MSITPDGPGRTPGVNEIPAATSFQWVATSAFMAIGRVANKRKAHPMIDLNLDRITKLLIRKSGEGWLLKTSSSMARCPLTIARGDSFNSLIICLRAVYILLTSGCQEFCGN